tara:strand:- start:15067 stop:15663 length:597 start_codon:yes stop_codon:yes gene_type:complete
MNNDPYYEKYIEYKKKYEKLEELANVLKNKFNKSNGKEKCNLTGKILTEDDPVIQCDDCHNYFLAEELLKYNKCPVCDKLVHDNIDSETKDLLKYFEESSDDEIIPDNNCVNNDIEEYNNLLLGQNNDFLKELDNCRKNNNTLAESQLKEYLVELSNKVVPHKFCGNADYHNIYHLKQNKNNNNDKNKKNCLFCKYNI